MRFFCALSACLIPAVDLAIDRESGFYEFQFFEFMHFIEF